ncbi:tetratricopeptide repeat protein, partial [candidate division KSB1 bacterium]|nr:tetratricopeptide repeat protein [candidate division KSB1 bacterium]
MTLSIDFKKDLAKARSHLEKNDAASALPLLEAILWENPDHSPALLWRARCRMAAENTEAALQDYRTLVSTAVPASEREIAEAHLVLGDPELARRAFEQALKREPLEGETVFLAALAAYRLGNVASSRDWVQKSQEMKLEWLEDSWLDALVRYNLDPVHYLDFEQIYLDAVEKTEGNPDPQNRWYSLNMPVYDLYAAADLGTQKHRALELARILAPDSEPIDWQVQSDLLRTLISDLATSQTDARLGLEANKLLGKNELADLARLILAMMLEHLQQFSDWLALEREWVRQSRLQELVPLLPLRIAVVVLLFYAGSGSD